MKFDEWRKTNPNAERGFLSSNDFAEAAWNAAIKESIKVAKEGHDYTPTSTAHNIAKRIKELK